MKKRNRRWLAAALACALALTGCGGGGGETTAAAGSEGGGAVAETDANGRHTSTKDTLVVATTKDYGTLMPYDWIGGPPSRLYSGVVETLYEYTEDLEPTPLLAESMTYDTDACVATIKLRQGVKFHDGTEMKASDVVYSIQYLGESSYGGNYSFDYDNVKAVDDYTVELPTVGVVGPLEDQLCSVYVFSQANTEAQGENVGQNMVATGPFKQGEWVSGDYLILDRFDDYWGGPAAIRQITMRFIAESSVAGIELESGGIDLNLNVSSTDYNRIQNGEIDGYNTYTGAMITVNFVQFNCTNITDARVRQAVAYAMDRQAILDSVYEGVGELSWSMFAPGTLGYDSSYAEEKAYDYNPEKAKELLAEAGYANGLTLRAVVDPTTERVRTLEMMTDQLAQVGITLDVQQYDSAAAMDLQTNTDDWDITARRLNLPADPCSADLVSITHPKNAALGGTNLMHFQNDPAAQEYGDLLDQAMATVDSDARAEIYKQAQELLMENLWLIPTHVGGEKATYPSNLKGFWFAGVTAHYDDIYFE